MPKNSQFTAKFRGNKHSLFPIHKNNEGSMKIGKIIPIFKDMLMPGDKISLSMGHLVRALPMQSPVMGALELNLRAFAVPMTALAFPMYKERDVQNFFNMSLNREGSMQNPFCFNNADFVAATAASNIWVNFKRTDNFFDVSAVRGTSSSGIYSFYSGSGLNDYLNHPTFAGLSEKILRWLATGPMLNLPATTENSESYKMLFLNQKNSANTFWPYRDPDSGQVFGRPVATSVALANLRGPASFYAFILCRVLNDELYRLYLDIASPVNSWPDILTNILATNVAYGSATEPGYAELMALCLGVDLIVAASNNGVVDYYQYIWNKYKIDSRSLLSMYLEYVFTWFMGGDSRYYFEAPGFDAPIYVQFQYPRETSNKTPVISGYLPDWSSEDYDYSYICAYWKYIADWCINSVIDAPDGPDAFYLKQVGLVDAYVNKRSLSNDVVNFEPFTQRFDNDLFTTAVLDARGLDVAIPTDGSIPDFREANSQQTIIDKLRNAGSRLKDVVKALMGFTPSNSESELSIPLWSSHTFIQPQSVLQNSQPTEGNPIGQYGGIGIDSGRPRHMFEYMNKFPVPCVVMVVASVSVPPSYYQGLPREFGRKSIFDFYLPDYAQIGEQEIKNKEVYFDVYSNTPNNVFGFNRRYYDWTNYQSEVHGELRTTLDFWHLARKFDAAPNLDSDFIGINVKQNNFNRVFADTSVESSPLIYNFYFEGGVVRELPRYIEYSL